ncbi:hypothetical protein D043_1567A, partial [Vibrio parahaemolyticus EKP-021]
MAFYRGI